MSKTYYLRFGGGDPRTYTGLAPTMLFFTRSDGQTIAPPGISELITGSGIYSFAYGTTQSIAFLADAATTSPGSQGRYVVGSIDPADRADEYGTSIVAGIGSTASSFGTSLTDPSDLFGYMKRLIENIEGNQTFLKASGALTQYSRGSSVALYAKTIANSVSTVIKS